MSSSRKAAAFGTGTGRRSPGAPTNVPESSPSTIVTFKRKFGNPHLFKTSDSKLEEPSQEYQ